MSVQAVRAMAISTCVLGIAGMIVGSIAGSAGWPVTFGIISAVAALCLIVATTVTSGSRSAGGDPAGPKGGPLDHDALGEDVERAIADLCRAGADEDALRALVGRAIRLGRLIGADGDR